MTFQDIFKKTFLENTQQLSMPTAIASMVIALGLGLVIFLVYRHTFNGVIYSKSFNISLVAVSVITSVIVITLTSNIVLSLGMVGALSIVRFRTAIKEPMDVVYLFWSITVGIVCGAGLYLFALIATGVVSALFLLMRAIKDPANKYVLIINCDKQSWPEIQTILDQARYVLRSKTINSHDMEIVLELDAKSGKSAFVNQISDLKQVNHVSLVNYRSNL